MRQVHEDRSLNSSPTWSPDGQTVIWSSDRSGVPNLYASELVEVNGSERSNRRWLRQITDLVTAGTFPAVDSAGEWIYLSVLSDDGWEIGRLPYDPDTWFDPLPVDALYAADAVDQVATRTAAPAAGIPTEAGLRRYSALKTLLPRYWLPVRLESQSALGRELLR